MKQWSSIVFESLAQAVPPVLVRVISQQGSSPRTSGARMLVRAHDIVETVGGGQYEALAIKAARLMQQGWLDGGQSGESNQAQAIQATAGLIRFSLYGVADMDMICGGELCLLLELLIPSDINRKLFKEAAEAEKKHMDFSYLTFLAPQTTETGKSLPLRAFLSGLPQGVFVPLLARTVLYRIGDNTVSGTDSPGFYNNTVSLAQLAAMREPGFISPLSDNEIQSGKQGNGQNTASRLNNERQTERPLIREQPPGKQPAGGQECGRQQTAASSWDISQINSYDTEGSIDPAQGYFFADPVYAPFVVHIFGGGHVSKALADCLSSLSFVTAVIEDRSEFVTQERFPQSRRAHLDSMDQDDVRAYLSAAPITSRHAIVIMTRGHAYDRDVLAASLAFAPGYLGMIGSKRKWAEVSRNLQAEGVSQETLARVHTPIGIGIGAETPEEIAISIAAELIAWRRGFPVGV